MANPTRTGSTFPPPIPEAAAWVKGVDFPADRPLINVSQAAPTDPPPEGLRQALADAALHNDAAHLYGPGLGMPDLRAELAARTSRIYGGTIRAEQVAITSGCNQAFCAVAATLAGAEDEILLPTPWYFNHKMWLDMIGAKAVALPTGRDLLPDPEQAKALITNRTKAITLVTPNNPTGLEYPADLLRAFRDLARDHGLKLIVDETYRDFHSAPGAPHDLFADPDWADTLIHLYSFSKAFRLTGHRVGAIISAPDRLQEVVKYIDTTTICPSQLGQIGALWGLRNLDQWLAGERTDILRRRQAILDGFPPLAAKGWELRGLGAYFAYVKHPFDTRSDLFAQELVIKAGILCLPATMFYPEGSPQAATELRIAFANMDVEGIQSFYERLEAL